MCNSRGECSPHKFQRGDTSAPLPNRSGRYQGTTPTTWLNCNTPCKSQLKNAWPFSPTIRNDLRTVVLRRCLLFILASRQRNRKPSHGLACGTIVSRRIWRLPGAANHARCIFFNHNGRNWRNVLNKIRQTAENRFACCYGKTGDRPC